MELIATAVSFKLMCIYRNKNYIFMCIETLHSIPTKQDTTVTGKLNNG